MKRRKVRGAGHDLERQRLLEMLQHKGHGAVDASNVVRGFGVGFFDLVRKICKQVSAGLA
ncbi:MAG: hypothetical protein H0X40_08800 [Chthoniobacterales bacterium]|nr:hypothetical protein [Chthoniobacterales bacterium]